MRVNFEIPSYLYDALKRQAEAQGRTVSDIMRQQVVEFIERDTERMNRIMADNERSGSVRPASIARKENADD
jgi:predicted transcriptional regulator